MHGLGEMTDTEVYIRDYNAQQVIVLAISSMQVICEAWMFAAGPGTLLSGFLLTCCGGLCVP